jgi:quinoprotein glucose dehydrogenase
MPVTSHRLALAIALLAGTAMLGASTPQRGGDWPMWGGEPGFSHYSELTQITPKNVTQLTEAWRYEIGSDVSISSPIIAGDRAFLVGAGGAIVALDAATGKEIWKAPGLSSRSVRGLTYWASADGSEARIFYNKDNVMRALDARTGEPVAGFAVDLRQGLDRDPDTITQIQSNAPSTVFGDLIITGALTGEDYGSPPGDIRAYDARTAKLVWTFRPLPRDGEPGSETWPKNARSFLGGTNNWTGMALDRGRAIVYAVTGSSTFDYWGGDRPGNNLYASSLLALDARTGKLLWHFQTIHHDLWDWDPPTPPVLISVRHDGKPVDAVVMVGKNGFIYAFNRVTGKPLWPIEERPVPPSHIPDEHASPTQPFPTVLKPFARQHFTADDLDPALPEAERASLTARLKVARNEGPFTPPDTIETVQMPGALGATNWGMLSGDPKRGMAYVISSEMPSIIKLAISQPIVPVGMKPYERGQSIFAQACAACHGADRKGNDVYPSLIDVTKRLPRDYISQTIARGRGHMPQFPQIRGAIMTDVIAYLSDDVNAAYDPLTMPERSNPTLAPVKRWRSDYGLMTSPTTRNPIIKPPWSQVTAYDMNTGAIVWQRPIGNDPTYKGKFDGPTGLFGRIGSALTASGLMFVATGRDQTLHALDLRTGKTLWTGALPAQATGLPSIYAVKGRQFVLVPAASGPGATGEKGHNAFVAFALPK